MRLAERFDLPRRLANSANSVTSVCLALSLAAFSAPAWAGAADAARPSAAPMPGAPLSIHDWLMRMHEGARSRSFTGTFVVSSGAQMSSARIWHVAQGEQQAELLESLTGPPRSVYRYNSEVMTFLPQSRLALREQRQSSAHLADFLSVAGSRIAEVYSARAVGHDRVAGIAVDVVQLVPTDKLRFGFRIWVEPRSGLVLKLQTLDADARVLEQAAFSEVNLDAPLKMSKLVRMMGQTDGYRVETVALARAATGEENWSVKKSLPGFRMVSRLQRASLDPARAGHALQWTFSDGLATVSLFVEPFDPKRHGPETSLSMGATQTLTRRLGNDWVTAMGEVPLGTLKLFVASLERKR